MRIAIVDGNAEDRQQLGAMVKSYCAARSLAPEVLYFDSGDALMKTFQPGQYQCVFLEIYLEGTDGMETARRLHRLDPMCRLVFATASQTHGAASYEVRAAWYLTKPFSPERFTDAMDAACGHLLHSRRRVTVHIKGEEVSLRLADIFFLDCQNRQAWIHLQEHRLAVDEGVNVLMERLRADSRFLMCNRSTTVNMDHVAVAEDHDFLLSNGETVPIRQRGRAALKKTYLSWILNALRQEAEV